MIRYTFTPRRLLFWWRWWMPGDPRCRWCNERWWEHSVGGADECSEVALDRALIPGWAEPPGA